VERKAQHAAEIAGADKGDGGKNLYLLSTHRQPLKVKGHGFSRAASSQN
jgi:hypothetical protein